MHRRLKILGLAMAAALALSAFAASSASAFTNFERETATSSFKGEQTEAVTWNAGGATISCTNGTFRGMTGTNLKEPTIETTDSTAGTGAEYSHCTFLNLINVPVSEHHCNFRFHASGTYDIVANGTTAEQAECNANGITWEAAGCKVTLKPQVALNGAEYENAGTGINREVIVKFNSTNIAYTSAGCPVNGTFTNGVCKKGRTPIKGFTSTTFATRAGIWIV
jgi:hypothetical protein